MRIVLDRGTPAARAAPGTRAAAASGAGTPQRPRAGVAAAVVDPSSFSHRVAVAVAGAIDVVAVVAAASLLANQQL